MTAASAPRLALANAGRTVTAAVLVMVAAVLAGASTAAAVTSQQYCNTTVPPKTRCNDYPAPDHSWETNKADAPWTGGAWAMCERITATNDYNNIYSRRCATALAVEGYWDDWCGGCYGHDNPGYVIRAWVGNDDDWPRIIRGVAKYGVF